MGSLELSELGGNLISDNNNEMSTRKQERSESTKDPLIHLYVSFPLGESFHLIKEKVRFSFERLQKAANLFIWLCLYYYG